MYLDPSCNNCCDLIGPQEVSKSHSHLQGFHSHLQDSHSHLQLLAWSQGYSIHGHNLQASLLGSKLVRHCLVGFYAI